MTLRTTVRHAAVAQYPQGATYGPRLLRDYEFVWLLSGAARWESGDLDLPLRPGTLLLVRPGMRDRFSWDPRGSSDHAYVHFQVVDPGVLGNVDRWPLTRALSPTDPMAAMCHYLLRLAGLPGPEPKSRANDLVGWLLDLFVAGPLPAGDEADELQEHVDRVVVHVRGEWQSGASRAMPLVELAAAARISSGHLSRVFRQQFGIGPVSAIELVRLARAATLLQRSNLTVGDVSTSCGFANPFHFSRRFSRGYGMPPRRYRDTQAGSDPLEPLARAGLLPLARRLLFEDRLATSVPAPDPRPAVTRRARR